MKKRATNARKAARREKPPAVDDRLRKVPQQKTPRVRPAGVTETTLSGFVLARLEALEKPKMEEELIEPGGTNPCGCNAVCSCVPVGICACDEVCTCDTVGCGSYCSCVGNCCVGVYWMPCV